MNHEPRQPRHRDEATWQPGREQTSDYYITHRAEQAPTPEIAQRIRNIYAQHGTAFAIYLALEGVDAQAENLEADFRSTFIGFYPDRQMLVKDTIATFGWEADLDRLLQDDPLLRAVVRFDHDEIWAFADEHFQIVELDGGQYVYERAPDETSE